MKLLSRHLHITALLIVFFIVTVQCTSTRWTVMESNAIDESEPPSKLDSVPAVLQSDSVTVNHPILTLNLYSVEELEFAERVLVERTVQKYRPKWGFAFLGTAGAALAFYAANTSNFIESPSSNQSFALNSTGALLTTLAFTNMRPVEEPIYTGETKFLRRSGTVVKPDTVRTDTGYSFDTSVSIRYEQEEIFSETFENIDEDGLRINLASLGNEITISGHEPGFFDVSVRYNDQENFFSIPVESFMKPVVVVTSPVAELRNAPAYDQRPPLTEVGNGSELLLTGDSNERWFQVQFGGSHLYVARESGEIQWRPESITADPTVVTVDEVPFGEISVEYAVPVIKPGNASDIGLIISNHRNNQIGIRRYIERDYRLMEHYYRNAFGVSTDNIFIEHIEGQNDVDPLLETIEPDSNSTIHLFIGGFAKIAKEEDTYDIELIHVDTDGQEQMTSLSELLIRLSSKQSRKIVAFIDLEFQHDWGGLETLAGNNGANIYSEIAGQVTSRNDNSTLIFSSRPEQSSNLYESVRFEHKYHHIFPYFIAQALQQRRTQLSDLVRHIENQVDYTSRRLHDRSQTVQAFGNLNLNLAE